MFARSRWIPLGLGLAFVGALIGVPAYANWSFDYAALQEQCWGATQASNCGSIGLGAGFWFPIFVECMALIAFGLGMAFVCFRSGHRARRPSSA